MTSQGDVTMVGESQAIRRVRALVATVAPTRLPVLIEGPTGSGKELVAQAIHRDSRRQGAMVAFNVCAIGDAMFEDALFGHVRGAYTGALSDAQGYLREADGGTVFLDEVSGLASGLQAKLLRAIETGTFRPIGARRDASSQFRLVAATNESLGCLVAEGRFRQDLAHRVAGLTIAVPPLRDRAEDIPALTEHFARQVAADAAVQECAIRALQEWTWPGNIRELRQVVEWALVLGGNRLTGGVVGVALEQRVNGGSRPTEGANADHAIAVRHELLSALERHGWRTEDVARELGVHRATLYRRMRRSRIDLRSTARSREAVLRA